MPVLQLPGNGAITQHYGEYPTAPATFYADPAKEAVRLDLKRLYGNYQPAGHDGTDVAANMGDPVFAPGDGTLIYSGWEIGLPRWILDRIGVGGVANDPPGGPGGLVTYFDIGEGLFTYMAHNSETLLDHRVGQFIPRGTLVARAGTSGRSGGVHIHWAVINTNAITNYPPYGRIDPMQFVSKAAPAVELLIPSVQKLPRF